jgi:hypothetical protein
LPGYSSWRLISLDHLRPLNFLRAVGLAVEELASLGSVGLDVELVDSVVERVLERLGVSKGHRRILSRSVLRNDLRRLGVVVLGDPCRDVKQRGAEAGSLGPIGVAVSEALRLCRGEGCEGSGVDCWAAGGAVAVVAAAGWEPGRPGGPCGDLVAVLRACAQGPEACREALQGYREEDASKADAMTGLVGEALGLVRRAASAGCVPRFYLVLAESLAGKG